MASTITQTEHECRPVFGRLPNGSYVCIECRKLYSGVEIRYRHRDGQSPYEWKQKFLPFKWDNDIEIIFFFNKGYIYKIIKTGRILYSIGVKDRLWQSKESQINWYSLFMLHRAQIRWRKRRFETRSLYLKKRFNLSSYISNYLTSFISPRSHSRPLQS